MKSHALRYLAPLAGAAFLLAASLHALAQDFPSRPSRFISPYPPGGVADIAARLFSAKLAELWKQPVLVENRVGGGGVVGSEHVARSAPDGYTLLFATVGEYTVIPHMYSKLAFDFQGDFPSVIFATDTPLIWAAHAGAPFNSMHGTGTAFIKFQPHSVADYPTVSVAVVFTRRALELASTRTNRGKLA